MKKFKFVVGIDVSKLTLDLCFISVAGPPALARLWRVRAEFNNLIVKVIHKIIPFLHRLANECVFFWRL